MNTKRAADALRLLAAAFEESESDERASGVLPVARAEDPPLPPKKLPRRHPVELRRDPPPPAIEPTEFHRAMAIAALRRAGVVVKDEP